MDRSVWKYFIGFIIVVPALMIVSVYLFFRVGPFYSRLKVDVVLAEYGSIEEVVSVQGIVVRREKPYHLPNDGELRWHVQDGQRVSRNQKLADILISEQDHSLILQQQLINMRLETIAGGGDLSAYSLEAMQEIEVQMRYLLSDIGYNIKNNQYELAFQNQQLLSEMAEQKRLLSEHHQLPEMSLEELARQKDLIDKKLDDLSHEIRALEAGYVAMGSDGLEDQLSISLKDEHMDVLLQQVHSLLTNEDPLIKNDYYRIIQDHRWHLIIPLESKIWERYGVGERIIIREPVENKEVRGLIVNTINGFSNEDFFLIVELNQMFEEWQSRRVYQLNIIYLRQEGLLVPATAVMTDDYGSKSVYKIDVNGYALRRPVNETARNDLISVLQQGTITIPSPDTEGVDLQIQTISQYDEIITNPETVIEGQKVR